MSRVLFFKEFLKNSKATGSITPSSQFLVNRMLRPMDFQTGRVFIELGPGTGCFTEELLRRMHPDAKLLVFETSKPFCDALSQKIPDKRLIVINDTAEKMVEYIEKYNLGKADCILSGLPLTNIPVPIKTAIIEESVKALKPEGIFTQYQYLTTAAKLLKKYFKQVKIKWTPANFPPAFYYICKN